MTYYAAKVVAVTPEYTTVRIEASGQEIRFGHEAHNALPQDLRVAGVRGFVSFPKAPPVFTAEPIAMAV